MRPIRHTATLVAPATSPNHSQDLPQTGFQRQVHVLKLVPFSKSTLWRRVKDGTFPQPLKLSNRVTVWRVEDIRLWIEQQGRTP